jgi:hypothetical protein
MFNELDDPYWEQVRHSEYNEPDENSTDVIVSSLYIEFHSRASIIS